MSTYISPYYIIATSGPTRDGRVIKPEWLLSAAETYDPEEAEALLWYNHSRWYNPGGSVVDCKSKTLDDGRVQILARLKPTTALMYEAEQTEVPYMFSVELRPLDGGGYYLDGLAYTHNPASKAVDKMEFSQQRPDLIVGDFETVEKLEFKAKGLLSRLFSSRQPPAAPQRNEPTFPTEEDHEMTPEQFALLQQVNQKLDTHAAEFKTIKDELAEVKTKQAEFSKLDTKLDEQFTKLEQSHNEMTKINEALADFSTGRFKPRRTTSTGGAGANAAETSEIDY